MGRKGSVGKSFSFDSIFKIKVTPYPGGKGLFLCQRIVGCQFAVAKDEDLISQDVPIKHV